MPDQARAQKAVRIFGRLRLTAVIGSPRFRDCCEQWVLDLVAAIFGARDPVTKRQIVRETLLLVSKKNSKSSLAAGIMVSALIMHTRRNEEFLILAPTKDIADNSFWPARGMIEADPILAKRFKANPVTREIKDLVTGAVLAVKAADADVVGGQNATSVLIDELWLFGKKNNAENIISEATGSLVSRPDGFVVMLSTQSDVPPAGVFAAKLDYHRKVRDGKIDDPQTLPVIYEFPEAMVADGAWRDPENWYIPNPNLGISVDQAWLRSRSLKAEQEGNEAFRVFAAKHLNFQVGTVLRADGWAGAEYWARGIDPELSLDKLLERSEVCTIGVDGGGLDDLLGIAVLGRERGTRRWLAWTHAMISPEGLSRRKANMTEYEKFMADGDLTLVEELPDDLEQLVEIVERVRDAGLLGTVGVDAMGLPGIIDDLAKIGVTQDAGLLEAVRQGISLMGSIKAIERKLVDGSFRHGGQRMMAWCTGNARIIPTPTAARVARDETGYGKIDPLMALFDAADAMSRNPDPVRKPEYQAIFLGRGRRPDNRASSRL